MKFGKGGFGLRRVVGKIARNKQFASDSSAVLRAKNKLI